MDRTPIYFEHLFDLRDVVSEHYVVEVSADAAGTIYILALAGAPDYRTPPPHMRSKLRAKQPNRFRIFCVCESIEAVDIAETRNNFRFVQPLGDEWLLVRARAANNADLNACVYSVTGEPIRAFHAGDGIEDVQTIGDSQVWVSYFDEGVFNYPSALGSSGLVRLDPRGNVEFRYIESSGEELFADCYALNVCSDQETWLCYYTEFALVRLAGDKVDQRWDRLPVHGSHAFAVHRETVVFTGGYGSSPGQLLSVDLMTSTAKEVVAMTLDGHIVPFTSGFGRGSRLFVQAGESIFVADLAQQ